MRGAECIVNVKPVAQLRELLREVIVILFFFFVEPQILEQQHVAVLHRAYLGVRLVANAVICKRNALA